MLSGPVDVGAVVSRSGGEESQGRRGLAEEVEELRREVRELKERLDRLEGMG